MPEIILRNLDQYIYPFLQDFHEWRWPIDKNITEMPLVDYGIRNVRKEGCKRPIRYPFETESALHFSDS